MREKKIENIFANDYRLLKDVTGICLNKAGTASNKEYVWLFRNLLNPSATFKLTRCHAKESECHLF